MPVADALCRQPVDRRRQSGQRPAGALIEIGHADRALWQSAGCSVPGGDQQRRRDPAQCRRHPVDQAHPADLEIAPC